MKMLSIALLLFIVSCTSVVETPTLMAAVVVAVDNQTMTIALPGDNYMILSTQTNVEVGDTIWVRGEFDADGRINLLEGAAR